MPPFRLLSLLAGIMLLVCCLLLSSYDNPRLVQIRDAIMRTFKDPLQFMSFKQNQEFHYKHAFCAKSKDVELVLPDLSSLDSILLEMDHHHLSFLLETSGASQLTVRQACAVESAVRNSGRNVVLLMTALTVSVCSEKVRNHFLLE